MNSAPGGTGSEGPVMPRADSSVDSILHEFDEREPVFQGLALRAAQSMSLETIEAT
jgi:hypothetical protein